jgi:hypothetical protein
MDEWDETDLTPEEVRAIWESATPVDVVQSSELTAASVEVLVITTSAAPTRVDVRFTRPIPALIPTHAR